jgi:hypothetical protein
MNKTISPMSDTWYELKREFFILILFIYFNFLQYWNLNSGLEPARQVPYHLSHTPRTF